MMDRRRTIGVLMFVLALILVALSVAGVSNFGGTTGLLLAAGAMVLGVVFYRRRA